jgi:macrolide transport system ATP-binding/permease protein
VIAMLALGTGAKRDMADRFVRFGSNVVTVHSTWWRTPPRGLRTAVPRLSYDDALAIARAHAGIVAVSPAVSRDASVSAGGQQRSCNVVGTTPANVEIRNLHPPLGRFFTDRENLQRARVALLGRTVSRELFGEAANPVGREIKINRIPFTVIGVLPERGSYGRWDPDDVVYVPLFTNMYRVIGRRYVDYVEVKIAQEADVDEVIEGIHRHLQQRYRLQDGDSDAFDVRNEVAWRQAYSEMTRTLSLLLGVIAGISLIVGGIGIMNIMLVTVTERTREIGLRKAVGARGRDILLQFLIEAAAISVIGGVLGILLGILSAKAVAWTLHWTVAITPWSVGLAFGFSAAVGLVFGFWPARRAARLHPAEALRSE